MLIRIIANARAERVVRSSTLIKRMAMSWSDSCLCLLSTASMTGSVLAFIIRCWQVLQYGPCVFFISKPQIGQFVFILL